MNPNTDNRIVLTLDAGGTNFVFSAIQANQEIAQPVTLPSNADILSRCIDVIKEGFRSVMSQLKQKPVALSFAFPGPSDYKTGIIGKLNNLPAFTGSIPLAPILSNLFKLPVFINNDGDLYAYGEALSGFLPYVNNLLNEAGIKKKYRNLIGLTLGTGFGGGIVQNEELLLGDNSMAAEVWLLRNRINPATNAEEGISIRAIRRVYAEKAGINPSLCPDPKDIFEIASGKRPGNVEAAQEAFRQLGSVLGDVLGNLLTIIDGVVVIGGGLSGAMNIIFPTLIEEINATYISYTGNIYPRLVQKIFNIEDPEAMREFLNWKEQVVEVPGTGKKLTYYSEARIPIGTTKIGTSKAVSLGAYAYALKRLNS
jgi:glucokinase